jgi:type I restriction enzyme S subunit
MAGEWETRRIGDLGRVVTGKTPSTAVAENFGGNYPFITIPDMDGRREISSSARTLSEQGAQSLKTCRLPAGAVMMSCIATIGNCGITTRPSFTNQQINSLICGEDADPKFVYYSFTQLGYALEAAGGGGSVYTNVSKSRFEEIELTLPPLAEQKAIAAVLGALDDKIELNRRMNATLEAMARALFQSWFVDFDPVRAKLDARPTAGLDPATAALFPEHFDHEADGVVPKGWSRKRWGDIATLEYGKSLRDYRENGGKYRVFGTNGPIGFHNEALCKSAGIVIGRKGAYRGVHYSPEPFFVIDTAFYLKPKALLDLKWAYYELVRFDINSMDSGSAIPSTSRDDFYGIPVIVPPPPIQEAFGKIVGGWFATMFANDHQSRALATLRDTLLPKLLSGELQPNITKMEVVNYV